MTLKLHHESLLISLVSFNFEQNDVTFAYLFTVACFKKVCCCMKHKMSLF